LALKRNTFWRLAATALAATAVGHAAAQTTQAETHRDAATRNVGSDTFMMQNARAFYCNLTDDNNAIVIAARATNSIRVPLTQVFDDRPTVRARQPAPVVCLAASSMPSLQVRRPPSSWTFPPRRRGTCPTIPAAAARLATGGSIRC
jgi:hypothetical protein